MPFSDQIKARMTNAQRLVTSVPEHTVHPSPALSSVGHSSVAVPMRTNICSDGLVHINHWSMRTKPTH